MSKVAGWLYEREATPREELGERHSGWLDVSSGPQLPEDLGELFLGFEAKPRYRPSDIEEWLERGAKAGAA
jgi:hypothetical protein